MLAEWHSTPAWVEDGTARSLLTVESGRTGHVLYRAERDRKALLFGGGDLVPGGPDDLLEGSTNYNDTGFLRFSGIGMPDGRRLWTRDDIVTIARFGAARDRDHRGDTIIYGRIRFLSDPPRQRSRIDALRGASGARLWGHGDVLVPSDAEPIEPEPSPKPTPGATPTPTPTATPTATSTPTPEPAAPPAAVLPAPAAPARSGLQAKARIIRRQGRRLTVLVTCSGPCLATLRVTAGGRTVGRARITLRARRARVTIRLTSRPAAAVRLTARFSPRKPPPRSTSR
jgi:hypothetical protein